MTAILHSSRTCAFPQVANAIVINAIILDEIERACNQAASYILNQQSVLGGPEGILCSRLKLLELLFLIKVWGVTFQVNVDADISCRTFVTLVAVQDITTVLPPFTLSIEDFVDSVELDRFIRVFEHVAIQMIDSPRPHSTC